MPANTGGTGIVTWTMKVPVIQVHMWYRLQGPKGQQDQYHKYGMYKQCSGSGLDADSIGPADTDPRSGILRIREMIHKKERKRKMVKRGWPISQECPRIPSLERWASPKAWKSFTEAQEEIHRHGT